MNRLNPEKSKPPRVGSNRAFGRATFGGARNFWRRLGPGLITGAADDDPSGIVTYSIAGAKFGLATLWLTLATLPFMVTIQRMAGRIGLISGKGLAGNMKKYYPRPLLILIALIIVIANIINIGADISAMAAAFNLIAPTFSPILFAIIASTSIIIALIFLSYRRLAHYLKWLAIAMLSYIVAVFFVDLDWLSIVRQFLIPKIIWSKDYLLILAAFWGTTISPYLFFWQASEAVEEERMHTHPHPDAATMIPDIQPHGPHPSVRVIKNEIGSMYTDVRFGMFFSNLITFFIIILTASTLFKTGIHDIETVEQVASVLKPLAGPYANILFLIGILVSGVLAIPVLAGSAAYALAELFGWKYGFDNKFGKAKQFYLVIILSTVLGILIPVFKLHPVNILFYTAVIYGMISPILILLLIHMANNPKIMGKYTSRLHSNIIAYILFILMATGTVLTLVL